MLKRVIKYEIYLSVHQVIYNGFLVILKHFKFILSIICTNENRVKVFVNIINYEL